MRRPVVPLFTLLIIGAMLAPLLGAAPTAPIERALRPVDAVIDQIGTAAGACEDLDTRLCLFPFPNDHFTAMDATTPTKRRVDLHPLATPRNVAGKPVDPTEWNRNDGFSPGSTVLTVVPGLDLTVTFGLDDDPETGVDADDDHPWAVRDERPDAVIEDPALSMMPDAPIVLLNADTGERHPYWAELDEHAETIEEGEDRTLIVRPLVQFTEGHRYIVALRNLRDADDATIPPVDAFAQLLADHQPDAGAGPAGGKLPCDEHPGRGGDRGSGVGRERRCDADGPGAPAFPDPADIDPADRGARYLDIFTRLEAVGVDLDDLHLAWDFHIASGENLAGRALATRDDAFEQLGDTNLADLVVEGDSPAFEVTDVIDHDNGQRTVHGTLTVPNYLSLPQDPVTSVEGIPVILPQSRFLYESPTPGPMDTPIQNPVAPTWDADFLCRFRTDVAPESLRPTLYGHGLLGTRNEANGSSTERLRGAGHAMCAVDWKGMSTEDITNVALILHDISFFPSLADRVQQGYLGFHYLGRALVHPEGMQTDPAFQDADGDSLLDISELFYNGNSQGGIMGAALAAMAPDFTKAVLGVPGGNYSTLLNRSVDWEGEYVTDRLDRIPDALMEQDPELLLPSYASFSYTMYPGKVTQQLVFSLLQMLWDRAEGNGYTQHMTDNPYPNTPPHQVLFEVALGDYQVANIAAEVQARTVGADFLGSALANGRHWERAYTLGNADTPYLFTDFATPEAGPRYAPSGSAIVYWDSCNPLPPNGNVPPWDLDEDPHSDPRKDPNALAQKVHFYATGQIIDVLDGQPYWSSNCRHDEVRP